jgi:hypothetical protein
VTEGLITQADLDRALSTQRREGKLLGRVLLDMGLVGHADMLTALAKQQGLPTEPRAPTRADRDRLSREAPTQPPSAAQGRDAARGARRRVPLAVAGVVAAVIAAGLAWAALHGH